MHTRNTDTPTRATRTTLRPGVYSDKYGLSVWVRLGSGKNLRSAKEERFPHGTSDDVLDACHARQLARLTADRAKNPRIGARGSLPDDCNRYFGIATLSKDNAQARRRHFDWLIAKFPNRRRDTLEPTELRAALNTIWTIAKKGKPSQPASASLKNDYRTSISNLFNVMDAGKHLYNPIEDVPRYDEPDAELRNVPYELVEAIIEELRDTGNQKGASKPPSKTKARVRVLSFAPLTPAQLWTLPRANIDWIHSQVIIPGRHKGTGTLPRRKPLIPEALEAFRAFDAADCWLKKASRSSMWRTFTAARDRAIAKLAISRPDLDLSGCLKMSPYWLRHTFGTLVVQATDDVHAAQEMLDHADPRTTRRYTQGAVSQRLKNTGAAIAAAHAARRLRDAEPSTSSTH